MVLNVFDRSEKIIPPQEKDTHTHTQTHTHKSKLTCWRKEMSYTDFLLSTRWEPEWRCRLGNPIAADLCSRNTGQDENSSSCHYAAPLISQAASQGQRMSQGLLSPQVSHNSALERKCIILQPHFTSSNACVRKLTGHKVTFRLLNVQTWPRGRFTFSRVFSVPTKREMTNASGCLCWRVLVLSLIWDQPKPQPWAWGVTQNDHSLVWASRSIFYVFL